MAVPDGNGYNSRFPVITKFSVRKSRIYLDCGMRNVRGKLKE